MEATSFSDIMSLLQDEGEVLSPGFCRSDPNSPGSSVVSSCSDATLHDFDVPCSSSDDLAVPFATATAADISAPTAVQETRPEERPTPCEKPVRLRAPVADESTKMKNMRNALAARENRRKKKNERETLESKVKYLTDENSSLKSELEPLRAKVKDLEGEVSYLRGVLSNDSCLAKLLQNIPFSDVRLRSSKRRSSLRSGDDQPVAKRTRNEDHRGVCLHVRNDNVSLEFCKECSGNAGED